MPAQHKFTELDHVLNNINAFDLLGLSGLSQDEQNELTVRFARAALRAGIEKYFVDNQVSNQTLENIENRFNGQISSLEAQEYLVNTFPGILDTVKWTTVDLKKKALIKQVTDFMSINTDSNNENVYSNLIKAIRSDDLKLFEESFKEYKTLKGN
jgi:hypothetical protein